MNHKIYLFVTLLLAILFSACDDVYDHVSAPPQAYDQEAAQTVNGFTFTLGSGLSSAVVLTEENLENETKLEAIKTTATPAMAEGATVKFIVEASKTADFATTIVLPSVSNQSIATISAVDLNEVVKSLYGKAPNARTIHLRATYYIVDGTSSTQMPDRVTFNPITVTPIGPVIETGYYLIGDINGWNIGNLNDYKFNHSGKDVYEDPFFTILVENVTGYFKIVPKSSKDAASWDGVLGNPIDGNTELSGDIILKDAQAMRVTEPGWVKITLNMMEYTYSIEIIGEMNLTLYVPGGHQGWSPATAPTLYSRNLNFIYDGYVYFSTAGTEFKFTSKPGWDGINYGNGGDGTLSTDGGAGNLTVSEPGYYKLTADLSGSPYKYSTVKTEWGLIGNATTGGWDASTPMSFDPATGLWSVTTSLSAGEMKFRANNGWDINLGGALSNLGYGGDNIPISEAGAYKITLDLSNSKSYKATIVKQ